MEILGVSGSLLRGNQQEVIQKLNAAIGLALQDKVLLEKFAVQAAEPRHGTSEQYGAFIQAELSRWSQIIKANNVRID